MFTDGMQIPAGTTAEITTALPQYLFQPLMNSIAQAQYIEIYFIAFVVPMCLVILIHIWKRLGFGSSCTTVKAPYGWDGVYFAGGMSLAEYDKRKRAEDASGYKTPVNNSVGKAALAAGVDIMALDDMPLSGFDHDPASDALVAASRR